MNLGGSCGGDSESCARPLRGTNRSNPDWRNRRSVKIGSVCRPQWVDRWRLHPTPNHRLAKNHLGTKTTPFSLAAANQCIETFVVAQLSLGLWVAENVAPRTNETVRSMGGVGVGPRCQTSAKRRFAVNSRWEVCMTCWNTPWINNMIRVITICAHYLPCTSSMETLIKIPLMRRHIMWVTKVMTPASMRHEWKQETWFSWPTAPVFGYETVERLTLFSDFMKSITLTEPFFALNKSILRTDCE